MKQFVSLLMGLFLLGAASAAQATTIIGPIEVAPASTDGLWAYSFSDQGAYSNSYYSRELPNGVTHLGYVDGTHGNWPDSFMGSNNDGSDNQSTHVFETYLMSSINQTVRIGLSGDDGHSIFVNGEFKNGDGFPTYVSTDFEMIADTEYKISLVLNNNYGGWHANFGLGLLDENDNYTGTLFAEAPYISMNATGDFAPSPAPEPTTMVLFGFGLLGLAGVGRRKLNQ